MAMTFAFRAHCVPTESGGSRVHFSMDPPAGVFFAGKAKKITKKITCWTKTPERVLNVIILPNITLGNPHRPKCRGLIPALRMKVSGTALSNPRILRPAKALIRVHLHPNHMARSPNRHPLPRTCLPSRPVGRSTQVSRYLHYHRSRPQGTKRMNHRQHSSVQSPRD